MKAVIPAAGFGTRFLPFTKSVPKELIPVVDKPVLQYVVEEAAAAGVTEILIILSEGKESIIRHFGPEPALEQRLEETKKFELLEKVRSVGKGVSIRFTYQHVLNGLGGAILCAKDFVGNDPFAVLLGDNVTSGDPPVLAELLDVFRKKNVFTVAVEQVPRDRVNRYGIIDGAEEEKGIYRLRSLVEKPDPEDAPSDLAIASRYVFPAAIMDCLEHTPPGKNNEVQLTDAMRLLLERQGGCAVKVRGKRHDAGEKLSFLRTTLDFAMMRDDLRGPLLQKMRELIEKYG